MWILLAVVVAAFVAFFGGGVLGYSTNSKRRRRWFIEAVSLAERVAALEGQNKALSDSLDLQQFVRESIAQQAMGALFEAGREVAKVDRLRELLEAAQSQVVHQLNRCNEAEARNRYMVDARGMIQCAADAVATGNSRHRAGGKHILSHLEAWAGNHTGFVFGDGRQRLSGFPKGYFLCYNSEFRSAAWKVNAARWYDPSRPPTVADVGQSLAPVQLAEIVFFVHPNGETYILKSRDGYDGVLPTWNGRSWNDSPKLEAR